VGRARHRIGKRTNSDRGIASIPCITASITNWAPPCAVYRRVEVPVVRVGLAEYASIDII
jgi:hypothetical protein